MSGFQCENSGVNFFDQDLNSDAGSSGIPIQCLMALSRIRVMPDISGLLIVGSCLATMPSVSMLCAISLLVLSVALLAVVDRGRIANSKIPLSNDVRPRNANLMIAGCACAKFQCSGEPSSSVVPTNATPGTDPLSARHYSQRRMPPCGSTDRVLGADADPMTMQDGHGTADESDGLETA